MDGNAKHVLILKFIDLSHDKVNIELKFILLLGYFLNMRFYNPSNWWSIWLQHQDSYKTVTTRQLHQDSCIKTVFLSRINIKLTSWTCLALNTLKAAFAFTVSRKDTITKNWVIDYET